MRSGILSYSNVMSTVGVFIALGGTSYAISQLPRNSVASPQVKDGSLQARDLSPNARVGGPRGPRGVEGPAGPAGVPGPAGERGPSDALFAKAAPNITLSGNAGTMTEVRRLALVPGGAWNLRFHAQAYLGGAQAMYASCRLTVNGEERVNGSLVVGGIAPAVQEGPISLETFVSETSPFLVKAECWQEKDSGGNPALVIAIAQISATQVGRVAAN